MCETWVCLCGLRLGVGPLIWGACSPPNEVYGCRKKPPTKFHSFGLMGSIWKGKSTPHLPSVIGNFLGITNWDSECGGRWRYEWIGGAPTICFLARWRDWHWLWCCLELHHLLPQVSGRYWGCCSVRSDIDKWNQSGNDWAICAFVCFRFCESGLSRELRMKNNRSGIDLGIAGALGLTMNTNKLHTTILTYFGYTTWFMVMPNNKICKGSI